MAADDLATCVARSSAAMILTEFYWNIPNSSLEKIGTLIKYIAMPIFH